ncbi:hypothetical protein Dtox_0501 [Desulfofarcimen acetoxidans DSM 771]|uniref:Peptidase C80 domain-containing protein n=1 Tax=Desulfofarcimen acetoxidans (strain ATCC 49208 / DSM 771 / KCTC 5769 / VKM B-1644 / 5575) TaxID=485916 RepID=C8W5W9_DESAS|nr:DUF6345 domain-containing protein [Desulfofarcimen acetoxidans]ACV61424.1 hypothetical protein Dtox_0501 [Desulfofarcimen acetoxidans DSM 771]
MKKILTLFLVIVFGVYSSTGVALAATDDDGKKEFSVLSVGDYDSYANLTFEDANYFDDYLQDTLGWTKIQYEVDPNPNGTGDNYNPTDKTAIGVSLGDFTDQGSGTVPQADQGDLLYFMGHAYPSEMLLKDELDSVSYTDVGSTYDSGTKSSNSAWDDDLEWIILGACSIANRDSSGVQWAKTLLGSPRRAHGIYGYKGSSPSNPQDLYVAQRFFQNAAGSSPQTIWSSWINANNATQATNWGVIEHKNNRDYLWGKGTVTSDTTGDPVIYQYQYNHSPIEIFNATKSNSVTNDVYGLNTSFNVSPEELDEDTIINQFFDGKDKLAKNKDNNGNLLVEGPSGSNLEIYNTSGAVLYSKEITEETINFGTDNAISKAEEFIKVHGGRPFDATISKIWPLEKTVIDIFNDTTGTPETIGYLVEYKRVINGMLVDGYNGDSIRVLIDKNGVSNYYRLWRDIKSNDGNKKVNNAEAKGNDNNIKNIIASGQALEKAKRNANKIYKINKDINPTDAELVYFSKSFMHDQQIMEPAWRVKIDVNAYLYVNAYTGEVEEY